MRIDNEYIKNHPAEKPPTGEFATTPYDDYDELRNALIDIIPEFTMKLKVDPRTKRLEFSTDINSVFDIAWLALEMCRRDRYRHYPWSAYTDSVQYPLQESHFPAP